MLINLDPKYITSIRRMNSDFRQEYEYENGEVKLQSGQAVRQVAAARHHRRYLQRGADLRQCHRRSHLPQPGSSNPPTLIIDEADALYGSKRAAEQNEDLRHC